MLPLQTSGRLSDLKMTELIELFRTDSYIATSRASAARRWRWTAG